MDTHTTTSNDAWFLRSNFPAFWPASEALTLREGEFQSYLARSMEDKAGTGSSGEPEVGNDENETSTHVSTPPSTAVDESTTGDVLVHLVRLGVDSPEPAAEDAARSQHLFMEGLLSHFKKPSDPPSMDNKMLTENGDVAYRSTNNPLVDLFTELEEVVSGPRLRELLNAAWENDPLATLKIVFNARSIHLGKGSRSAFYRCAGWLGQHHPLTLVASLRWLSRPVMEKAAEKKNGKDEDENGMVLVPPVKSDDDVTRFDVKHGVAHGYWKDILNILAFSANGKLDVLADPSQILNTARQEKGQEADEQEGFDVKERRRKLRGSRHDAAIAAWEERPVHRALHMTVARLFAEQLRADLALLRGADEKAKQQISLCAKWAPSQGGFHDKHTFVPSSIAEILYPEDSLSHLGLPKTGDEKADREVYLRYAREAYRKDVSALRQHLQVVERDITTKTYSSIKYDRVPSLAMKQYSALFAEKDTDRFEAYIDKVVQGKANISGATLLPSTMVHEAQNLHSRGPARLRDIRARALDGQWRSLVQRVRDSGTLESCIAVCDVSYSMESPTFRDGTVPMDSAIGLSLLVAEVMAAPFGGAFITFSNNPAVVRVRLEDPLHLKIEAMRRADWSMNTDFVAVFERLILPMAVEHNLTQEQMVKRVIVFSDMQFDQATTGYGEDGNRWSSSFESIQRQFRAAGYEMPQLVFWNLAGGRAGYTGGHGDPVAPKPVEADQEGTALVSGYSQGMLKLFMDKGVYGDEDGGDEDGDVVEVAEGDDGDDLAVVSTSKRQKMDPLRVVMKAIGHKAYDMVKVVD